jgi:hypothetical protein
MPWTNIETEIVQPTAGLEHEITEAWLEAVGLDRSTPYRGIAVAPSANAIYMPGADIASYRPVTGRLST